jgi:type II secretory pathway pseudopilin PulG
MAKQRQVRIEQGLSPALMEQMQERSDEQLESETKYRSVALSILGSRAAERYDAEATRTYFRRALAASRPQERPQIRRMANASLALAEHRASDLKVAVEKLGHEAPPKRALMGLRLMGLIAPPKGAPTIRRVRGMAVIAAIVIALLLLGLGIVELISLPFGGGIDIAQGVLLGLLLVVVVLSGLAIFGRRRQKTAQAKAREARARPAVGATAAKAKALATSKASGTPKASGTSKASGTPKASGTSKAPGTTKASGTTKTPGTLLGRSSAKLTGRSPTSATPPAEPPKSGRRLRNADPNKTTDAVAKSPRRGGRPDVQSEASKTPEAVGKPPRRGERPEAQGEAVKTTKPAGKPPGRSPGKPGAAGGQTGGQAGKTGGRPRRQGGGGA